jgi:hypothetical protein
MTTEESINVKIPDSEIDKIIGRGIIRVARYAGNFVYCMLCDLSPIAYYVGSVTLLCQVVAHSYTLEPINPDGVFTWMLIVLFSAFWMCASNMGVPARFAKWLKIDEV